MIKCINILCKSGVNTLGDSFDSCILSIIIMHVHHAVTKRIWNSPYDLQIRLSGALYTNQGLVEVYCKNLKRFLKEIYQI